MPQTVSKPEPSAFTASAEHEQMRGSVVPSKVLKSVGHSDAATAEMLTTTVRPARTKWVNRFMDTSATRDAAHRRVIDRWT